MSNSGEKSPDEDIDSRLMLEQSLRYAEDIARVYEEEKAKRKQLEMANERLRIEIAERQRAEDALRQSEERLRGIFETAQDCIYIKDRSLRYVQVNPAMESLFQRRSSEILGKTDRWLYSNEAASHLEEVDGRVLRGQTVEEEHTRLVNGIRTTFLETKAPLRDKAGHIVGLCGIARNITDRARKEAASQAVSMEYPSEAMREVLVRGRLVASQESLALLLGESGTGKDYMARYIHENSRRANGPFYTINCASVPPELAESELFGHEPGAFTGARVKKRGLLELAEGGTLFLNEICEMSLTLQAKLLTFLDTRSFTRVGGEKNISVNARLIAATNRQPEEEVAQGRLREALFYRLNVFSLSIPPLRRRKEDIPILVEKLLAELKKDMRLSAEPVIGRAVMATLTAHHWPGNVRELRNRLERALILTGGGDISLSALGLEEEKDEWLFTTRFPEGRDFNEVTRDLKRSIIVEALIRSGGNKLAAARLLGISRNSLNHYLKKLQIRQKGLGES